MAEEQENHRPSTSIVVAMKGHPGTGKSTLARALSAALKIPLLDKDDVRDCTLALQQRHQTPPGLLNDLAYDVVFAVAATQLAGGLSVVVDSPLSRRAHLDRLVRLASPHGARVAVVECRPGDEAEWRRRLEARRGDGGSWHKPATWGDMERLLEAYGGCTEYDLGGVPRLVVDTTRGGQGEEAAAAAAAAEFVADVREGRWGGGRERRA